MTLKDDTGSVPSHGSYEGTKLYEIEQRVKSLEKTVFVVVFLLGMLCGKVFACDSYEECIDLGKSLDPRVTFSSTKNDKDWTESIDKETAYLKAIAYKLDEISKKLDKHNELVIRDESGVKKMKPMDK